MEWEGGKVGREDRVGFGGRQVEIDVVLGRERERGLVCARACLLWAAHAHDEVDGRCLGGARCGWDRICEAMGAYRRVISACAAPPRVCHPRWRHTVQRAGAAPRDRNRADPLTVHRTDRDRESRVNVSRPSDGVDRRSAESASRSGLAMVW